jgi:hypothetical protein
MYNSVALVLIPVFPIAYLLPSFGPGRVYPAPNTISIWQLGLVDPQPGYKLGTKHILHWAWSVFYSKPNKSAWPPWAGPWLA